MNSQVIYYAWFIINPLKELPPPSPSQINLRINTRGELGEVIVDGERRTLYFHVKDVKGNSNCNQECVDRWPKFFTANFRVSPELDTTHFSTNGKVFNSGQTKFKGWPMYYHAPEGNGAVEPPNSTMGEAENDEFFVAKPDYTVMLTQRNNRYGDDPAIYITDAIGRALYYFKEDSFSVINCSGDCPEKWVTCQKNEFDNSVPSILKEEHFDIIFRKNRIQPLTCKGWPLYYFSGDTPKKNHEEKFREKD